MKNIIKFLNENNIEWFPIILELRDNDGVKEKVLKKIKHDLYKCVKVKDGQEYDSYFPASSDFKTLPIETIKQRQKLVKNTDIKFTHIAVSTSKVQHIDIDTDVNVDKFLKIADKSPYYKSATKSYGKHIFITQDSGTTNKRPQFTTKNVELLNDAWSYAPIDADVFNSEMPIYHYENIIDDLTISKLVKVDKQDFELKLPKIEVSYKSDEIKAHCDNISIEYIDEYETWTKLVWSLKSIDDEKNAMALSKRSKKFNEKDFYKVWNSTMDNISIGTLMHFSKLSNAENYVSIKSSNIEKFIYEAVCYGETEYVAKMFYEIYKEEFIYVEGDKHHYHYNGVFWKQSTLEIRKAFTSKSFQSYFLKYATQMNVKALNSDVQEDVDKQIQLAKKAQDLASIKMKKGPFITEVLKSIPMYIHRDDVVFEKNEYIFCFQNAVYDLQKMQFVKTPVRDDYMTLSTGFDYCHPSDEQIANLTTMLDKIFPDKAIRKLYLMILSTQLFGMTLGKFIMANGNGRNGKGFLNELMLSLLGEYGLTGANAVLTTPVAKLGACPELAKLHNKRGVVFREPSDGSNLNSGIIKELTGGDTLPARNLYSDNTEKKLRCTIVLECNERPPMSGTVDDAMLNRLIDIPFVATFTDNINDVDEKNNVYFGDINVKTPEFKENHRCALFQILLNEWKDFKEAGMKLDPFIPEVVKQRGKEYLCSNTPILALLKEKYELTDNKEDIIKIDDLFTIYKCGDDYNNMTKEQKRKMTKKSFVEFCEKNPFTRRYYKERVMNKNSSVRNVLTNYQLKTEETEEN